MGNKTKKAIINYTLKNHTSIINAAKIAGILPPQLYAYFVENNIAKVETLIDLTKILSDRRFNDVCISNKNPSFSAIRMHNNTEQNDTVKITVSFNFMSIYFNETAWRATIQRGRENISVASSEKKI